MNPALTWLRQLNEARAELNESRRELDYIRFHLQRAISSGTYLSPDFILDVLYPSQERLETFQ